MNLLCFRNVMLRKKKVNKASKMAFDTSNKVFILISKHLLINILIYKDESFVSAFPTLLLTSRNPGKAQGLFGAESSQRSKLWQGKQGQYLSSDCRHASAMVHSANRRTTAALPWGPPAAAMHCQAHLASQHNLGSSLVLSWINSFSFCTTLKLKSPAHVNWQPPVFYFRESEDESMVSDR